MASFDVNNQMTDDATDMASLAARDRSRRPDSRTRSGSRMRPLRPDLQEPRQPSRPPVAGRQHHSYAGRVQDRTSQPQTSGMRRRPQHESRRPRSSTICCMVMLSNFHVTSTRSEGLVVTSKASQTSALGCETTALFLIPLLLSGWA